MPSAQLSFTQGEATPYLHARADLPLFKTALQWARNWVVLRYGGLTRTPGTIYFGPTKTHAKKSRFLPFLFKRAETYSIEAGDLYFRFWNAGGRIESPPGTPVTVVTPYLEADLKYIQVRQSADLVFIYCVGYWPRVLTRNSETSWSLDLYTPDDGPYLPINATATTLDPSGTSGAQTLTLSSIVGVNGGVGWVAGDVGRVVRYLDAVSGRWFWWVIAAFTSATVVGANFMGRDDGDPAAMGGHAATVNFKLGAWASTPGYPAAVGFYEERLISAGTEEEPTTVWGTVAQDTGFDDYSVSQTLVNDDAFNARLNGGQLNDIQWIADGKDILLGTEGSIRTLGRNDEADGFGPLNIRQKPQTEVSTSYIPGFFVANALIFLDVFRAKLFEALYANEAQGYVPHEMSSVSEHLLALGITSIAYQAAPHKVIWMTTDDGLLLAATYDRDQEVFGVTACDLGGDGLAEWVMSLPGTDSDGDQVWLIVKRTINGSVVRNVEVLASFYRQDFSVQPFPIYAHCAGFYDGAATSSIEDLDYAEGETYGVWGDGVDLGDATVEDGVLTLPKLVEAEQIVWGLRYSSLATTLRVSDFGTGQQGIGMPMVGTDATLDLMETGYLRAGYGVRTVADYGKGLDYVRWEGDSEIDPFEAAPLRTGTVPVKLDDNWSNNGVLTFETNSMLPATVRALFVEIEGAD